MWQAASTRYSILLLLLVTAEGCTNHNAADSGFPNRFVETAPPVIGHQSVSHTFVVSNHDRSTVIIESLSKSCACTNAILDSYKLAPGDQTRLSLDVQFGNRIGPVQVSCALENSTGRPWIYVLNASGYPHIAAADVDGISFGKIEAGQELGREVIFLTHSYEPNDAPPIFIEPATSKSLAITFLGSELRRLPDGVSRRATKLFCKLAAPLTSGAFSEDIYVSAQFQGEVKQFKATLSGIVASPFELLPSSVSLGIWNSERAKQRTVEVKIVRRDGKPLQLSLMEEPADVLKVQIRQSELESTSATLVIDVLPTFETTYTKVLLGTNHPSERTLEIPVSWIGGS